MPFMVCCSFLRGFLPSSPRRGARAKRGRGGAESCSTTPALRATPPRRGGEKCSLLERKDLLPVGLHVHDRPALRIRLVERLVETPDRRLAVVGVFALGVGVM